MVDRKRIEGGLQKTTGTIKKKVGEVSGDRRHESEGKIEKTEGRIHNGIGDAMDAIREVVNNEKD